MTEQIIGHLTSNPALKRHPANPLLSARDVPYPSTLVFNAGITKYQGQYVMVFRNDYSPPGTGRIDTVNLGLATSADGIRWQVSPKPCFAWPPNQARGAYDPRLTVIDGRCVMCFALDTPHGIRAGIAVTEDFDRFDVLGLSVPDNRNTVLFPEKIGGRYVRLERPFPVYGYYGKHKERFEIWLSESPDLVFWGKSDLVLGVEDVPFCNSKIGPGAPPVKTRRGWLTTFHAVDVDPSRGKNGWEEKWQKRYTAGLMLLDLNDPRKIVGLCREPILAPEASYEISGGCRNNVIFPGGMILEESGEVKIYYGAADTVECLATAHVDNLLALCRPVG